MPSLLVENALHLTALMVISGHIMFINPSIRLIFSLTHITASSLIWTTSNSTISEFTIIGLLNPHVPIISKHKVNIVVPLSKLTPSPSKLFGSLQITPTVPSSLTQLKANSD